MSFWASLPQPWIGVDTVSIQFTADWTSNPHTHSNGLNSVPLKIHLRSEPQNSALFGNKVFAVVIKDQDEILLDQGRL